MLWYFDFGDQIMELFIVGWLRVAAIISLAARVALTAFSIALFSTVGAAAREPTVDLYKAPCSLLDLTPDGEGLLEPEVFIFLSGVLEGIEIALDAGENLDRAKQSERLIEAHRVMVKACKTEPNLSIARAVYIGVGVALADMK